MLSPELEYNIVLLLFQFPIVVGMLKKVRTNSTPLDYRLPSTVESIQQGWLISFQSTALISGILAVISLLLLHFFENASNLASSKNQTRFQTIMEILGFASLLLNVSACASCFIILDRLGDVPYRAARQSNAPRGGQIALPAASILRVYGIGSLWRWAVWHWLICFLFGLWCLIAQIMLFVWVRSSNSKTGVAVLCLGTFSLLPWVAFILAPVINRLSRVHAKEEDEESFGGNPPSRNTTPTTPVSDHNGTRRLSEIRRIPLSLGMDDNFQLSTISEQAPHSPAGGLSARSLDRRVDDQLYRQSQLQATGPGPRSPVVI